MSKNIFKFLLKFFLTGLALFLVFRKIDVDVAWLQVRSAHWLYLLMALLFFVLSKIFSSFRLNKFFADLGIWIPNLHNIKLYAIGMFYNLFFPGGIGGDGYKVYLLHKHYKAPVKHLLRAVLLDRISGLTVLVLFMFILLLHVEIKGYYFLNVQTWALVGLLTLPLAFYFYMKAFFKKFMGSISSTIIYSFLVQLTQLVSAYFILLGLGISAQVVEYLFVFLLSSIVAVFPLTIGGVGARELVFIYSSDYMGIDKNSAVAFGLLFFVITAVSSLAGVFFKFKKESIPAP